MKIIYLVGAGEYSQRMLLAAFGDRTAADQYRTHYAAHPPRTLGPTAPVWVEELTLYESADEAIRDEEALK